MHVTGDISLGSISIVVTIIVAAIRIGVQIGAMQQTARTQGASIAEHAGRLNLYESRLVSVISDVQRMVGRMESTQDRLERMTGHRHGEGSNS